MGTMSFYEQLRWAVAHDPCRIIDRAPTGSLPGGGDVRLVLRVSPSARGMVARADVLVAERETWDADTTWHEGEMFACDQGFAAHVRFASRPHVAFYVFRLQLADGTTAYYVPCADGRSTAGELVVSGVHGGWHDDGWHHSSERLAARPMGQLALEGPPPGFQVTVYDPAFRAPEWLAGAVMYQIFPDRFARGSKGVLEDGLAYHGAMKRPVHLHGSWDEPVEWLGEAPQESDDDGAPTQAAASETDQEERADQLLAARMGTYDPVDFYGGSLDGICEKLPYLASLGVEVLYLNPVFEARSNHRYDTADYERIDPLLGTEDDFRRLCAEAAEHGISIVLDAVLSHTGNDSRYFNALGTYDERGAMQGADSPFYPWYDFTYSDGGVSYRSWWGFETLPEVDEHDPSWQRYILGDPAGGWQGVLPKWLAAGARGYRLDVADELPDDVLEAIRASVKGTRPDAAVIGEVWEDATTKTSYGCHRTYGLGRSLDSVMNYPLRAALLGFAIGEVDAHQLATFLKLQQANYPQPLYHCAMNLLSSHDVERMRAVLALGGQVKNLPRDKQVQVVADIAPAQDARAARLQRMVAGLLYALPGAPCIYYGDERGMRSGGDPFCRATFPWDETAKRADCGEDLVVFYSNLGRMRKGSDVLRGGALACAAVGEDVVCTVRYLADDPHAPIVVAATNRSDRGQVIALDLLSPELALPEHMRQEVLSRTGRSPFLACEGGIVTFMVAPCATRFFQWPA